MNAADFSFPLNVYFLMLQWEEGRADYLHYGLFEHADEPIHQAQARASRRLWAQVPQEGRVLEVGIGCGDTLAALRARGQPALGITPEAAQAEVARRRHGDDLPVRVTPLELLEADGLPFDVMLFQESAQYIAPLALFEAADRLLNPNAATLVVMDEFALRRDSDADFGLHLLEHFKALAARLGWQLVHEEDVTPSARLTIDVLLRLLARWRARLQQELALSSEALDALESSLHRYFSCYARDVYGYRVLRLERTALPALRPVAVDTAHPAPVLTLFEQVFGHPMSPAEWQWKYDHGRGQGVSVVQRDGRPVAFYGGLTRPLMLLGAPALGCQVCDVMVAPGAPRGLQRDGSPAHSCAASFLEAQIGFARRHAVGFGFPTRRAMQLAERLGLYERVDRMVQLRWPAAAPSDSVALEPFDAAALHEGSAAWNELGALWLAMQATLAQSVLGVRDPAWLHDRYGRRPTVAYECRIGRSAQASGLIVFRRHADHIEVMDIVAALPHAPALIAALRDEVARTQPGAFVKAWITASHQHHLRREGDGALLDDLDLDIPANAHTRGVTPATLRERWFLMAGDTDFR